jgi:hypothetical protein
MKHIHCPVNGWDCPSYTDEGHPCRCTLSNPIAECDDFAFFWDVGDDWLDDDWNPCETCGNRDEENPDQVAACNCCENAEFYYKPTKKRKKGLTNFN